MGLRMGPCSHRLMSLVLLSVGSAAFQQILRELNATEDSAEDSVSSETDSVHALPEPKPKGSILKVARYRRQSKKGSAKSEKL